MNGFLDTLAHYYMTVGKGTGEGTCESPDPELLNLHAASPSEVFGGLSQRAAEADAPGLLAAVGEGFSSTTPYHAVALLLLICYVAMLYRHPELFKSLRNYIFSPGTSRDQHLSDSRTNDPLHGFSWGRALMNILFVCTVTLRMADLIAPDAATSLSAALRMAAIPAVAAMFCLTVGYQNGLLALAGAITVSRPLTTALNRIKSIYFRLATLLLTPVVLMWVLAPRHQSIIFETVILLELLFVAVAFLRESFLLFMSKKLSIYHWILYLCTVEAFPLSLVCLLAARG